MSFENIKEGETVEFMNLKKAFLWSLKNGVTNSVFEENLPFATQKLFIDSFLKEICEEYAFALLNLEGESKKYYIDELKNSTFVYETHYGVKPKLYSFTIPKENDDEDLARKRIALYEFCLDVFFASDSLYSIKSLEKILFCKEFRIHGTYTPEEMQRIGVFVREKRVRKLIFHKENFENATLGDFVLGLKSTSTLSSVYFYWAPVDAKDFEAFAKALENSNVQYLNVYACEMEDEHMPSLISIANKHVLTHLDIGFNKFSGGAVALLLDVLCKNKEKFELCMSGIDVCESVARSLAQLVKLHVPITQLQMGYNIIDDPAFCKVTYALSSNSYLKKMDFGDIESTTGGFGSIIHFMKRNITITELHLDGMNFGTCDIIAFSKALKMNETIQTLSFRRNKFGIRAAEALVDALSTRKSLETLFLSYCKLEDEVLSVMISILGTNTSLKTLCLVRNEFGPRSAVSFRTHISKNSTLESLDIGYANLTNETLRGLSFGITSNTNLKNIDICGNNDVKNLMPLVCAIWYAPSVKELHVTDYVNEYAANALAYIKVKRPSFHCNICGWNDDILASVCKSKEGEFQESFGLWKKDQAM